MVEIDILFVVITGYDGTTTATIFKRTIGN
jgi:hypothetical protein